MQNLLPAIDAPQPARPCPIAGSFRSNKPLPYLHRRRTESYLTYIVTREALNALAVCCEGEAGTNIFFSEIGKVAQNLLVGHSAGQIIQNVVDGDAQAANASLTATLAGIDGDDLRVVHIG